MLKDLEQRQADQHSDSAGISLPVMVKNSPYKNLFIITITVGMTLLAVYLFYLQSENQRLASESQKNTTVTSLQHSPLKPVKLTALELPVSQSNNVVAQRPSKKQPQPNATKSEIKNLRNETATKDSAAIKATNTFVNKRAGDNSLVEKPWQGSRPVLATNVLTAENVTTTKPKVAQPSTMAITRKQLTPKTLVKQKMRQAKEAVANNNASKAEQLFEEVLLILPSETEARKHLAALWFGRQAYQAALNLLSQGIQLDANDNELRLLKAEIHSKRQQHLAAFQVLQSHPALDKLSDIDYHSMLANQAQASKQYQFAINAYLRLTGLQKNIGRWWLGLGIAYDSDSQFTQAKKTYATALNQQDLSSSARLFVSQRLQELGE
jgi:MSHA biogenesis protein MshN